MLHNFNKRMLVKLVRMKTLFSGNCLHTAIQSKTQPGRVIQKLMDWAENWHGNTFIVENSWSNCNQEKKLIIIIICWYHLSRSGRACTSLVHAILVGNEFRNGLKSFSSRNYLRTKATPNLHLTCSKNGVIRGCY